jgi:hypothetical protein
VIEGLIRCYPAQWRLWGTLEHRWAEAHERKLALLS